MNRRIDLPVVVLGFAGVIAALAASFLRVAPNRLLSGVPHDLHGVALAVAWAVVILSGLIVFPGRRLLVLSLAVVALVGLPWLAGMDARDVLAHASASTRVQLGAGFWLMWITAALLLLDRLRGRGRVVPSVVWAVVLASVVGLLVHGSLDALALLREYRAQRAPFDEALLVHLRLAVITLVIALLTGAPMGWWAWRARGSGGVLVGVLSFLQTVPSLALFALLMGPFAWLASEVPMLGALGFGGTGAAPAVFALVLYALLPVVRYTMAGLDAVSPESREAAQGLGMTRWQILTQVQLPLGWPVLLSGLRIVAVQTIGLAAVAALIGAGGLGRFVFLGIGQGATDMVLLGTVAIIALALVVDFLFQGLLALTERRA